MLRASALLAAALALAGCGKSEPPAQPATDGDSAPQAAAPAPAPAPSPAVEPTAAMGEQVFKRCVACHTIDKGGRNGIGPNLHGIVDRAVASDPGFSYSGAMKAKGGVWDEATLDTYLEAPMKALPGTRMAFAGVIDAADRKALILYMEAQK
ncbi:MAG: cytochrome c family protein [Alphaproteobacteria bacterium HGW-Alphaproteobacteria-13]|nr:MAG: cytochrome c family protein [Alphaproteobacteria bacterium HGW-Alphaproteobacteria-13]